MFERYTEKARRVIFFARYEASQYGSEVIETEHILLGLLREDGRLVRMLPSGAVDSIRLQIDANTASRPRTSTSVDLPLSKVSKRVLEHGLEEADRFNHRHIGPEHLLLGLLREKKGLAAKLLEPFGIRLEGLRATVGKLPPEGGPSLGGLRSLRGMRTPPKSTVDVHGSQFDVAELRGAIRRARDRNWLWRKASWKPRDCVIERSSGKISLDLTLAGDSTNFELIKDGWKKDSCIVCRWELFESADAERGTGYTNGRDWICLECYDRFWQRADFISGSYSDLT